MLACLFVETCLNGLIVARRMRGRHRGADTAMGGPHVYVT
ncbi:MAG: hypothetical protein OJF49_001627 [Ktedonobacterales bacterium]|nr:MAG: hypothetical protein OJF49_001627 [Ktedonobacterales bacterium]